VRNLRWRSHTERPLDQPATFRREGSYVEYCPKHGPPWLPRFEVSMLTACTALKDI
jgi:hypothetical protein